MDGKYNTEEVYALANPGNRESCHWDLSRIQSYEYEPFFGGLPNVIYKKVRNARFSVDLLRMISSRKVSVSDDDRALCRESIAEQVHRYPRRLIKILVKTLPCTKLLVSLQIDGLPLKREQITQLLGVIPQSKTLESVTFTHVPVQSAAVSRFLDAGSPYRLREIAFIDCELPANVATNVIQFIQAAPRESGGRAWALTHLDLTENDVDGEVQSQIDLLLQERHNGRSPVARNVDIDFVAEEEEDLEEEEEEDVVESRGPANSVARRVELVAPSVLSGHPFEDNRRLRHELQLLLEALRAVAVAEDVYLIGPGAPESAKIIEQYEQNAEELALSE
jgi:hypothetical protein